MMRKVGWYTILMLLAGMLVWTWPGVGGTVEGAQAAGLAVATPTPEGLVLPEVIEVNPQPTVAALPTVEGSGAWCAGHADLGGG